MNRLISIDTAKAPGIRFPIEARAEIEQLTNAQPTIYQNFTTKPTGAAPLVTDSAHTAVVLGSRTASYPPTVVSGRLIDPDVTAGSTSSYYEVVNDTPITFMSMEFDFDVTGSTNGGYVGLHSYNIAIPATAGVVDAVETVPIYEFKLLCFRDHYEITIRASTTTFVSQSVAYGFTYGQASNQRVEMAIDAGHEMVHVRGADGIVAGYSYTGHTMLGSLAVAVQSGRAAATDYLGQVKRFTADTSPLTNTAAELYGPANVLAMVGSQAAAPVIQRIIPRVVTITSSATPTINTDLVDIYGITAQTADDIAFTTNLSGTPTNGQRLSIYVVGTKPITLTWGTKFEAGVVALPTTTTTTERLDIEFIWNAVSAKWRCMRSGSAA